MKIITLEGLKKFKELFEDWIAENYGGSTADKADKKDVEALQNKFTALNNQVIALTSSLSELTDRVTKLETKVKSYHPSDAPSDIPMQPDLDKEEVTPSPMPGNQAGDI